MKQMLVLLSKCKQTEHDNVNGNVTVNENVTVNVSVSVNDTVGSDTPTHEKNVCSRFIH